MVEKNVYIVINEGSIEGVYDSAAKAEAHITKHFPKNWTPEQVREELDAISDECYYEKWTID